LSGTAFVLGSASGLQCTAKRHKGNQSAASITANARPIDSVATMSSHHGILWGVGRI